VGGADTANNCMRDCTDTTNKYPSIPITQATRSKQLWRQTLGFTNLNGIANAS